MESLFNEEKSLLLLDKIRLEPIYSTILVIAATPVLLEDDENYWKCKEKGCSGCYVYKKHNDRYRRAANFYKVCNVSARHFIQIFDESANFGNLLSAPLPTKYTHDKKSNPGAKMTTVQIIALLLSTARELNRTKTAQAITDICLKRTTGIQNKMRYYLRGFYDKTKIKVGGLGKIVVVDHTHGLVHKAKYNRGKNGYLFCEIFHLHFQKLRSNMKLFKQFSHIVYIHGMDPVLDYSKNVLVYYLFIQFPMKLELLLKTF